MATGEAAELTAAAGDSDGADAAVTDGDAATVAGLAAAAGLAGDAAIDGAVTAGPAAGAVVAGPAAGFGGVAGADAGVHARASDVVAASNKPTNRRCTVWPPMTDVRLIVREPGTPRR